jgi:outer membrane biosynthesis protein TonB
MNRTLSATIATAGLVLATLTIAGPAQAITNPADNPNPITVKGDDGKTYHDGEDTLPGYDDEACTYIPGAYFDFANNKVRYADGKSITWTEWDRATGYKEWKAKQDAPAPSAPKTTAPKPVKTTKPAAKPTTKPKATTKPKTTDKAAKPAATATPTTTTATTEPTDDAKTGAASTPASDDKKSAAPAPAPTDGADTTGSTDDTDEVVLADETTDTKQASADTDSSGTGSAGLLILGGLAGAGVLAVAGYSVARKRKGITS